MKGSLVTMKKKWYAIGALVLVLLLCFVFPYAKVEILSLNASEKLEKFDLSCFENVYTEGTPKVFDCKIYCYDAERYAKVLYVLGDCEIAVMVELEWNDENACWDLSTEKVMWTIHGGSAQEFYWPLYYPDKLLGISG